MFPPGPVDAAAAAASGSWVPRKTNRESGLKQMFLCRAPHAGLEVWFGLVVVDAGVEYTVFVRFKLCNLMWVETWLVRVVFRVLYVCILVVRGVMLLFCFFPCSCFLGIVKVWIIWFMLTYVVQY